MLIQDSIVHRRYTFDLASFLNYFKTIHQHIRLVSNGIYFMVLTVTMSNFFLKQHFQLALADSSTASLTKPESKLFVLVARNSCHRSKRDLLIVFVDYS